MEREMNPFFENKNSHTFIIAEIGTNHDGNMEKAKEMIERAAETGVDAVKFQVYKTEEFITKDFPVFPRAKSLGYKYQFERFKALELDENKVDFLSEVAAGNGVQFLASVFDPDSVDIVEPFVPFFKTASGDLINHKLLGYIASKAKPVLLSTGQADTEEVDRAVHLFPKGSVALLHCVSAYPTPSDEVNLLSIRYLKSRYRDIPVGYSDHTTGILACIGAVALGASIVEKHFTLDKSLKYGDHALSGEPEDFKKLVSQIRRIEKMLGSEKKECQKSEEVSKLQLRRVFSVNRDLRKNDILKNDALVPVISEKNGIRADRLDTIANRKIARDIKKGHILQENDLKS